MIEQSQAVSLITTTRQLSPQLIEVSYTLKNTTANRILVFDHYVAFGLGSKAIRDEFGVNIFLDQSDSLRLVRGVFGTPPFMSVVARPPIVVSPVEPGATLSGSVRVAQPTSESNVFFPAAQCDPARAVITTRARLQIGWVEFRPTMTFRELVFDEKKFVNIGSSWGQPVQRVAEADISGVAFRVCRYPGQFDRPALAQ